MKVLKKVGAVVLMLSASMMVACGSDEPEDEFCEHMVNGPNKALTAATSSTGAPSAAAVHTRHDITLSSEGYVSYEADEAAEFVVALDKNVTLAITDSKGAAVAAEKTETMTACAEVVVMHTFDFEVGTYNFKFGPTTETEVRMVIEEEHGEHMHE